MIQINEEILEINRYLRTVCGYNADELIIFADACKRKGITENELHGFITNAQNAILYANDLIREKYLKEIDEIILFGECKEDKYD